MRKKRQLKVLEITSYPPPRAGWGMRVYFLKQEMEKQGHICTVLNTGKSRFLTDRDFVPVFGGVDFAKKVLAYRLRGYLIHMHLNGDSPKGFVLTVCALIISILTFRRPVITFHAGPVQKYFPRSKSPNLNILYKIIFTIPKNIICNSEIVKEKIIEYDIRNEKIFPIQAFSRQYMEFIPVDLPNEIENFFDKYSRIACSYVFFRPEFFIENMIQACKKVLEKIDDFGLLIMGSSNESEEIQKLINSLKMNDHVLLCGDQDHDAFLTVMNRSGIYLRTPVKDGVCSSVLEALSLGVPVVASENGTRPKSVITYNSEDFSDMVEKILYAFENREKISQSIERPVIKDTIIDEIEVLRYE